MLGLEQLAISMIVSSVLYLMPNIYGDDVIEDSSTAYAIAKAGLALTNILMYVVSLATLFNSGV